MKLKHRAHFCFNSGFELNNLMRRVLEIPKTHIPMKKMLDSKINTKNVILTWSLRSSVRKNNLLVYREPGNDD